MNFYWRFTKNETTGEEERDIAEGTEERIRKLFERSPKAKKGFVIVKLQKMTPEEIKENVSC